MAVAIKIEESQGGNLVTHDIPVTLVALHVQTLKETITTNNDIYLARLIERPNHHSSNTIFNLTEVKYNFFRSNQ